ncbi:MAG: cytochrome c nitrite reductase small subunit [Candidatus Poribacteria bacterium]|nr:cytochrome c nitrite reductase small subunit [Candidatus Poribacteria bacterium]
MRALLTLGFLTPRLRFAVFAVFGIAAGLGLSVAHISRATSYLSDDPEACVNCHVMTTAYGTWQRSSHMNVAVCNDCHVPHENAFVKYAAKAMDGARHTTVFTLRVEPQAIRISKGAIPTVEKNCRSCHASVIDRVHVKEWVAGDLRCWDCHRDVPHGRARSLSTVPRIMAPELPRIDKPGSKPTIGGRAPRPEGESSDERKPH